MVKDTNMMHSLLENTSAEQFMVFVDQLPIACRIFDLTPDNRLIFVKANPAADHIFKMTHAPLEGQLLEKAFPNIAESVVPFRYKQIIKTGKKWTYNGVYYHTNGVFVGLFNITVFRLGPNRVISFSTLQEDKDTKLVFLKKKMNMKEASISYPESTTIVDKSINKSLADIKKRANREFSRSRRMEDQELDNQDVTFTDLFTINELENIQKAFTKITNVGSIITMPDGRPITRARNFCTLCSKVIRKTPKGLANCIQSDAFIGKPNPNGPTLRPCLSAGLWDCGTSIIIGDKHVANWMIGQVRLSDKVDEKKLVGYALEIGADPDVFMEAYHQVPVISYLHFHRICHSLFLFANLISEMAYQNLRLVRAHTIQGQISRALQASEARLQHLSSKLILTQEEERKQLAVELHDGIGQSLTAVKFSVDSILLNLDNPRVDIKEAIRTASSIIKDSIADVRRMQVELRPRILDELGIIATITWFCREFRSIYNHITLETRVTVTEEMIMDQLKPAVFRIIQEAFNNAAKYCEGNHIFLALEKKEDRLVLEIKDNGIGFDLEEVLSSRELNRGLGLDSMRERAELCNGSLDIISSPGHGTTIQGTWMVF